MANSSEFGNMTPEFMQKALNDYGRREYQQSFTKQMTPAVPLYGKKTVRLADMPVYNRDYPPRFAPNPIHVVLKLVDKTMGVQTEFNMNITYETLTQLVGIINADPIYQSEQKTVSKLLINVDEYNATGKVSFVDENKKPKTIPFGRKIVTGE
jgi:hypothetical protein